MLQLISTVLFVLFAIVILFISIFRSAVPNYEFSQPATGIESNQNHSQVDYYFPSAGINPSSPIWPLKAFRDKIWLLVNFEPERKVDLLILYADKRLMMARTLMQEKRSELSVSTASKAERYLYEAYLETEKIKSKGGDPTSSLNLIAKASLKHREVLENMMEGAPDDGKPVLNQIINLPKEVYESAIKKLLEMNRPLPGISSPQTVN